MVTLDFQGLHERPCKGYDNPDSADSDYERWKPHDDGRHKSPDGCFLGRKFEYTRRKQESECFNGEDFEGIIDSIACPCTEADYECDVGWEMDQNEHCVKKFIHQTDDQKKRDCEVFGHWFESKGYRQIPGDRCQGGLQVGPERRGCGLTNSIKDVIFSPFKSTTSISGEPSPEQTNSQGQPTQNSDYKPSGTNNLILAAIVLVVLYYGWPIIEAIILILPIPNAPGIVDTIKTVGNTASDMVSSVMKSDTQRRNARP